MVTKADLKRLEAEVDRLEERYREQERSREKLIDAAVTRARRQAEKDTIAQQREIDDTRKAHGEALHALEVAKISHTTDSDEGLRIGTILHEWSYGSWTWSRTRSKTGRTGVVRVWDRNSAHPPNVRWSLPRVGEKYIRVLRKDDTESINFAPLSGVSRSEWHPADWKPPVEKRGRF